MIVQSHPGCHLSVKSKASDWLYRVVFLWASVWSRAQSQLWMVLMHKCLPSASPNIYVMAKPSQLQPLHLWLILLKHECLWVISIILDCCSGLRFWILHQNMLVDHWDWKSWFLFGDSHAGDRCLDCFFVLARVVGKDWTRSVSTWMSSSCGDKGILNRQQSCGMTGRTHGEKNSFTKGMVMPWWEVSCPQPRLGKRRKKLWLSEPEKDLEQEKKRLLPAKTWKQALLFCRNPMTLKHYILLD